MDFIMEYVKGINLSEYLLKKKGILQQDQMKLFIKQILDGLVFLHDHGVVHRNIKVNRNNNNFFSL